mmetsp:Transcript_21468/g.56003  ORF Transcript_21468/g.56003 Transcript_21468/m.56003 type:complete len:192 (+) Transcript_21468:284-859(+)
MKSSPISAEASAAQGATLKRVTSATAPIRVSWILECGAGHLGLCFCPGKHVSRGQTRWERDMVTDLQRLRDDLEVTTVVCLLGVHELRSYKITNYADHVTSNGLKFGPCFPIVEMAAPDSPEAVHGLVQELVARMANGEVLAVHCRGGVGRAGLLACCVMLYLSIAQTAETAIRQVRTRATQTSCWHGACT